MAIQNLYPAIRPTLDLNFAGSKTVDPRITFNRASTATYFDEKGVLRSAASGVPRIDHNPVTGECLGLLIEEQRTNLLTYSKQFDNAAWAKMNSSVTPNVVIAPDGTLTAYKVTESATTSVHEVYQATSVAANTAVTVSAFFKAAERPRVRMAGYLPTNWGTFPQAVFDLVGGVVAHGAGVIENIGGGWFKCSISGVTSASPTVYVGVLFGPVLAGGTTNNYTGDGTSGIYIWGAQLEAGAFPTSYIKTEAASVTRATDSAVMTGSNFSSWYRQDEGTMVAEMIWPTTAFVSEGAGLSFSDGTNANRISIPRSGVGSTPQFIVSVGSNIQANLYSGVVTAGQPFKVAAGYKQDNFGIALNGTQTENSTDNSGEVPVVNILQFGQATGSTTTKNVKRLTYYPKRLTNDQLIAITQ